MKIWSTIILIGINFLLFGQDTTFLQQRELSGKVVRVIKGADTTVVGFYKNGVLESIRCVKNNRITGSYDRFYPNGKKMWSKTMKSDIENGPCTFYNKKGEKVAELNYENGTITDTIFISETETLLLGKATWYEVVHGGMYREENLPIQVPQNNPYQNYPFTLVKIKNAQSIPIVCEKFETDTYGAFSLCLQKGEYGFFPLHAELKKLTPGQYCPAPQIFSSGHSGWNMTAPLKIETVSLVTFHLHFLSESNAP